MAFSPVDIPIQEMLQSDFVVDLAEIHNTNVLLLKDKLEDLLNNFEIDTNVVSIGTANPINSIRSTDIIIQDGGFTFQTGTPVEIIARLRKNEDSESIFNVDHLTVDIDMSIAEATIETLLVNGETESDSLLVNNTFKYDGSIIESKETITLDILRNVGVNTEIAKGTITLTNTSKRNIYVTLSLETTVGDSQVWSGTNVVSEITDLIINLDFDADNPPAANQIFTIYVKDVVRKDTGASLVNAGAGNGNIGTFAGKFSIKAGTNQSSTNTILLHHDLVEQNQILAIDCSSQPILPYGANVTFNYSFDSSDDRLVITSKEVFDIISA